MGNRVLKTRMSFIGVKLKTEFDFSDAHAQTFVYTFPEDKIKQLAKQ
jgi:hypothetical protein